jgi:hypothetical protein
LVQVVPALAKVGKWVEKGVAAIGHTLKLTRQVFTAAMAWARKVVGKAAGTIEKIGDKIFGGGPGGNWFWRKFKRFMKWSQKQLDNFLALFGPKGLEAGQARNIEGLRNVVWKLEDEEGGLARHLQDVRRERRGELVSTKSRGQPHSHVTEITEARNALQTRVDRLKNSL